MFTSFVFPTVTRGAYCICNLYLNRSKSNILIRKMGETNTDLYYDTVMKLVKEAGKMINEKVHNRSKKVEQKSSDIDLVTETDQAVEKLLIDGLSKAFKDHKFIGEESVASGTPVKLTDAPTWIIDPIDGTLNFVHAFPHSCISIALFINQKPEIGIIFNPMLNQMFTARRGKGAFYNGERINVSNTKALSDALIMFECGTARDAEKMKTVNENYFKLLPKVHGFRSLGSAALNFAMVATGGADAYFEFGIHVWDMAAGILIVREAGGVVIDPSGGDLKILSRRALVASTQELAEKLAQQVVSTYYPTPDDS
ncbi:inositol monophosphatase 1 [Diabrotica undecimpunctata]|uniref:inositol monophosphatase 1 n=1 Tax=Diabrotica undecimpunctata TaxID=50387 RepID=UPI003B639159